MATPEYFKWVEDGTNKLSWTEIANTGPMQTKYIDTSSWDAVSKLLDSNVTANLSSDVLAQAKANPQLFLKSLLNTQGTQSSLYGYLAGQEKSAYNPNQKIKFRTLADDPSDGATFWYEDDLKNTTWDPVKGLVTPTEKLQYTGESPAWNNRLALTLAAMTAGIGAGVAGAAGAAGGGTAGAVEGGATGSLVSSLPESIAAYGSTGIGGLEAAGGIGGAVGGAAEVGGGGLVSSLPESIALYGGEGASTIGGGFTTADMLAAGGISPVASTGSSSLGSTLSSLSDLGKAGSALGSLISGGSTVTGNKAVDTDKLVSLTDPFHSSRAQYGTQLNQLMSNPDSIDQSTAYKFQMQQGLDNTQRQAAASGMGMSGNALAALTNYSQGLASQEYNNQFNRLATLSGANWNSGGQAANSLLSGTNTNTAQTQAGYNALASGLAGLSNTNWGNVSSTIGSLWDDITSIFGP